MISRAERRRFCFQLWEDPSCCSSSIFRCRLWDSLRASLQDEGGQGAELRKVPEAIANLAIELAGRKSLIEVAGGVVRRPGWQSKVDRGAGDSGSAIAQQIVTARWQLPTVGELERAFPGTPVQALLAHLVRAGTLEQVDRERYGAPAALAEFRATLEATLKELGSATPADLRERFALSRKYLIPLLEWADRRGVTERRGDSRVLARLTGRGSGT